MAFIRTPKSAKMYDLSESKYTPKRTTLQDKILAKSAKLLYYVLQKKGAAMQTQLKQIREAAGKTQEEVAFDLNIELGTYQNWEQGRRDLNGKKLIMLATYFGVTTDTILGTEYAQEIKDTSIDSQAAELLRLYAMLDKTGRAKLVDYADDLVTSGKYIKTEVQDNQIRDIA